MTKKKIAGTKNVYELAQERLKVIFNEFDNIYVSFSFVSVESGSSA